MKRIFIALIGLFIAVNLLAQNSYNIIPQPQQLTPQKGVFTFRKGLTVAVENELFLPVAELLTKQANAVGALGATISKGKSGSVVFSMNPSLGKEAYTLSVSSKKINIQASTGAGAFYALQTLMQLMPPAMSGDQQTTSVITIPNCSIEDAPRFGYRGLMLDVGRLLFCSGRHQAFFRCDVGI